MKLLKLTFLFTEETICCTFQHANIRMLLSQKVILPSRNTSKLGGYHEQLINSTLPPTEGTIMMTSTSQSGNTILGSKWKQISVLQCGLEPATTVPSIAMSRQLGFSKQLIMKKQIKSWSGLPVQRDQEWWTVQDT